MSWSWATATQVPAQVRSQAEGQEAVPTRLPGVICTIPLQPLF